MKLANSRELLLAAFVLFLVILGLPRFDRFTTNIFLARTLLENISHEPVLGTYTTDMQDYLRTYYEVRKGQPYYLSFAQSSIGNADRGKLPGEIWGWKLPVIFYVWSFLPGPDGVSIYFWFLLLVLAVLYASYKLAYKFVGKFAILSPYMLASYFVLPLTDHTLFQVEWWALCFFILGLTSLIYRKKMLALIFFFLCIFTRELFLFHLLMLALVYCSFRRFRDLWIFVLPAVSLAVFYIFVHLPNVYGFESFGSINNWWRTNWYRGWYLVRPTLSYASWNYFVYNLHPLRIFFALSSAGLLAKLCLTKNRQVALLALVSFLPFFVFIFFGGIQTKWQDYWGIYYIPLSIIFVPIALSLLYPNRQKDEKPIC